MRTCLLLALFASVVTATPVSTVLIKNVGVPLASNGYYVAPYTLLVGSTLTSGMCIDYPDPGWIGDTWTAYLSYVDQDLSDTYHPGGTVKYKEAAWLFEQILQPKSDRIGIQGAAWSLFDPAFKTSSTESAATWLKEAALDYSSGDYSKLQIVSSVNGTHQQEFIIVDPPPTTAGETPEPATVALLGGAFTTLAFVRVGCRVFRRS